MHYEKFIELIQNELVKHPDGLTWVELKNKLNLPFDRPCQTWIYQMEQEIDLTRSRKTQRTYIWKISPKKDSCAVSNLQ